MFCFFCECWLALFVLLMIVGWFGFVCLWCFFGYFLIGCLRRCFGVQFHRGSKIFIERFLG